MDNPFGGWFESARARGENADELQLIPFRQIYERMPAKKRRRFELSLSALQKLEEELLQLTCNCGDNFFSVKLEADRPRGKLSSGRTTPTAILDAIPGWKEFLLNRAEINRKICDSD